MFRMLFLTAVLGVGLCHNTKPLQEDLDSKRNTFNRVDDFSSVKHVDHEYRERPDRYYSQVIDDVFKSIEDRIVERVWAMTQEKLEDMLRSKCMTPGPQPARVENPPSPGPKPNDQKPRGLILADERNFWSFNPNEQKLTKIAELQKPVGAFDIHGVGPIFWSEEESPKNISVNTSNLPNATLNSVVTIFEDVRTKPKAMAMDNLSGNLYVIDDLYVGKLFVLNVHTRNFSLLITDLNNIQEIVVDSNHDLIFMLQDSNIILKANTSGNLLGQLLTPGVLKKENHQKIQSITLDRSTERIYWVKDSDTVRSSDYEGNDLITTISDSEDILDLTISASQLFRLLRQDSKTQLVSCKLTEDGTKCINHHRYTFELPSTVRSIHSLPSEAENDLENAHPCNQPDRGGCQQLCFATSSKNYTCGCTIGMQLDANGLNCRNVSEFILYTWGNIVRGVTIDDTRSSENFLNRMEVFWPTPLTVESIESKGVIDFDYGLESDQFFFSDDNKIYVMGLRYGGEKKVLFQSPSSILIVEDLAYDWLGDNLYYTLRSTAESTNHSICVMSVRHGSSSSKTLGTFKYRSNSWLGPAPFTIVVDPSYDSVLYDAADNDWRWIRRYSLNGTILNQISNVPFFGKNRMLTLDYENRRVYRFERRQYIEYANYDGSNPTDLPIEDLSPFEVLGTIAVHRNWIYLSYTTGVWRRSNSGGKNLHKIIPVDGADMDKTIGRIRLISSAVHLRSGINIPDDVRDSCSETNNPCEQLCFPASKFAGGPYCDCKDGMKVDRASGKCTTAFG